MRIFLVILMMAFSVGAQAIDSEGALEDPALQARFEQLTWELRCLVCQNQNIADSNADLARDLRDQVRNMLLEGRSDAEILSYMTDRYGDFVLYRPRFTPKNWFLWAAPAVFLLLGIFVLVRVVRRQSPTLDLDDAGGNGPEDGAST